jgi:hypothetical protein
MLGSVYAQKDPGPVDIPFYEKSFYLNYGLWFSQGLAQ